MAHDMTANERWGSNRRGKLQMRPATFQERCGIWMRDYYGADDISARMMGQLFLASAIELFQATGGTRQDALESVTHEFDCPSHDVEMAVGGLMMAMGCYGSAIGVNMTLAGETVLKVAVDALARLRAEQTAKPAAALQVTAP